MLADEAFPVVVLQFSTVTQRVGSSLFEGDG